MSHTDLLKRDQAPITATAWTQIDAEARRVLSIVELDDAARGAVLDLAAVVSAAEKTAHAEDDTIFNGFKAGGIEGIIPSASQPAITIPDDFAVWPSN